MAFGQLPQMFWHFEECGIALLACAHGDDLAGVFPRPRHGYLPGWLAFRVPIDRQASACPPA